MIPDVGREVPEAPVVVVEGGLEGSCNLGAVRVEGGVRSMVCEELDTPESVGSYSGVARVVAS